MEKNRKPITSKIFTSKKHKRYISKGFAITSLYRYAIF